MPLQKDECLRRRMSYYVQPANNVTRDIIKNTGGVTPTEYGEEDLFHLPNKYVSSYFVFLAKLEVVEILLRMKNVCFNVFVKKPEEIRPRFFMRKSSRIDNRNIEQDTERNMKLFLVPKREPTREELEEEDDLIHDLKETEEIPIQKKGFSDNWYLAEKNAIRLKKRPRPKGAKLKLVPKKKAKPSKKIKSEKTIVLPKKEWLTYVVIPHKDRLFTRSVTEIRQSLLENGLSTQSLREGDRDGTFNNICFENVWEMNGDALFRLWRYAREKNSIVHFSVYRTTKDGIYANFESVFYYPNRPEEYTDGRILTYKEAQTEEVCAKNAMIQK